MLRLSIQQAFGVPDRETILVNPNAELEIRQLPNGEPVAVIGDFLVEPEKLRQFAVDNADKFAMPPKSYPGLVLDVDDESMTEIYRYVRMTLSRYFSFFRGDARFSSMLSMTTLKPEELSNLQRLCHNDPQAGENRRNFAFVLYLFDDERLGGTGFYRWKKQQAIIDATALELEDPDKAEKFLADRFATYQKPACYITESTEIVERMDAIPAKFNRLIFYSGEIPHSAQIARPELLSNDLTKGRLTLNCFASVRPK